MRTRILGRTGLAVSEVGLGGLFIAQGEHGAAGATPLVRRAAELGINLFDTAPTYPQSEQALGRALRALKRPILVSTKLGGRPTPFDPKDKRQLRDSIRLSLEALDRPMIDILFIHEPDRPRQYDWWEDPVAYDGPVLELAEELKAEGLIRHLGIGGTTAYEMAPIIETGRFDVVLTAFNYSLLWREAEHRILPAAKRHDVGLIIGSPLQQGWLAARWSDELLDAARWLSPARREQLKALYRVVDEVGIPLPELALRWVLSNPDVSLVLTGARSVAELEQNVRAAQQGPLPGEVMERLQLLADRVPFRPYEEPFGCRLGQPYFGPGVAR